MKKSAFYKWLVIGLVLFVGFFIFSALSFGELIWFTDMFSFLIVFGLAAAYGLMFCKGGFSLLKVVKGMKTGALYAGGISFVIVFISMLQIMGEDLERTGGRIAVAFISLMSGLLISAGARVAEVWLTHDEPQD
ncbi:MAG: hypothetical protein FWE74_04100 [Oscillospiraceae bacterium]|nr:hypothetical protein [Oscillospiraceae bacterium]